MESKEKILAALLLLLGLVSGEKGERCGFPAIYNFGDSNSDTGGRSAAIREVTAPHGETFFGKPSGRVCDGRLIIDFIAKESLFIFVINAQISDAAEDLALPYLSAYLDSIGTNFRHGANFATGGSSILPGGYSPFHLDLQISQFIQFKGRTSALYEQLSYNSTDPPCKNNLPSPQDFSNSLYTFDIGQNDLSHGFQYTNETQVRLSLPSILEKFSQAVNQLYTEGARFFWVHNTGPIGCLPYNIIYYQAKPRILDENGCVEPQNAVAREFNRQLNDTVSKLREQLPNAAFTYVDVFSAKYTLISNASNQGFEDPSKFCCGSYYGYHVDCGNKEVVNGTVYGNPCISPSRHISWDGIHYTQAANSMIAKVILSGALSDPPNSVADACHSPKSI
ncbi:hypothetical protein RJ640_024333 [Escallonia rubra]|uniref:Uncharacterized protein n=1 Tax=Escallonia rubra TaxID=112253 RepID=A0AA88RQ87_9ASTE|nr:hypothetical protein RJ640_024333 [Escallonia rubra]